MTKIYPGGNQALNNVDLEVKKGEFLILLGLSGSGKSTLLRCINRLISANQGTIDFMGNDVTGANNKSIRDIRRQIGMVYQQFNLVKNLSALTNVISGNLGYMPLGKSIFPQLDKEIVRKAMETLMKR